MHATVDTRPLDSFRTAVARVRNADVDALTAWVEYQQGHSQLFASYYERWGKPGGT